MQNRIYLEQYVHNKISKSYNKCHADLNLSLRIALSIAFRHAAPITSSYFPLGTS